MKIKKALQMIEKVARKEGRKPLYYQDEYEKLWIGCGAMICRLDETLIIPKKTWEERALNRPINGSSKAEDIRPTGFLVDNISGLGTMARLFLSEEKQLWIQDQFYELLKDDVGYWRFSGSLLYFMDSVTETPKAVISALRMKNVFETESQIKNDILKLAELVGGDKT